MSILFNLLGTFLMFSGFFSILFGAVLYKTKQEDLGRMYMSATMMGGGELSDRPMVNFLSKLRGDDPLKKRWAGRLFWGGWLLAVIGASF